MCRIVSVSGKTVKFMYYNGIKSAFTTIAGLTVAPKSPANAKKANMAVPPLGHFCEEILIEPGHIIPTAKPQSAQPANPRTGVTAKDANK